MANYSLKTPLQDKDVEILKIGDKVLISGILYTARDSAHKKLVKKSPIDLKGQIIYYCGPTPAKPGEVIGSAGPTTSGRMDKFTEPLLKLGLRATIGKGKRSKEVQNALKKHKAVYLVATGGAGALLSKHIKKAEIVAYPELGPGAVYKFEVENFPTIVANDILGNDIFKR